MKDQDLLLAAGAVGGYLYLKKKAAGNDKSIIQELQDEVGGAISTIQDWLTNATNPLNNSDSTVAGFTLADWAAAAAQGTIPITSEQLTQRWLSAAQMPNVADAISILFSGMTVDIDTVIAAMNSYEASGGSYTYVPIDYLAANYGNAPYYLPGGVPLGYLYSGTTAANVLLIEALSGSWAHWSTDAIIAHISAVRGF